MKITARQLSGEVRKLPKRRDRTEADEWYGELLFQALMRSTSNGGVDPEDLLEVYAVRVDEERDWMGGRITDASRSGMRMALDRFRKFAEAEGAL